MGICSEVFYKHWILLTNVWHLPWLSQGRNQGKAKCGKKRLFNSRDCWKSITRHRYIAISQSLRNGWRYMGICSEVFYKHWILFPTVWHLPRLSPGAGAQPGEAKMCKKCAKMANCWTYGLNYWETVEDRWVRYMLRCVWQVLNPLFIHVTFTAIVSGGRRSRGRPKCAYCCKYLVTYSLQLGIIYITELYVIT